MNYLTKNELNSVNGGAWKTALGIAGAAIVFLIGLIGGYKRPYGCSSGK